MVVKSRWKTICVPQGGEFCKATRLLAVLNNQGGAFVPHFRTYYKAECGFYRAAGKHSHMILHLHASSVHLKVLGVSDDVGACTHYGKKDNIVVLFSCFSHGKKNILTYESIIAKSRDTLRFERVSGSSKPSGGLMKSAPPRYVAEQGNGYANRRSVPEGQHKKLLGDVLGTLGKEPRGVNDILQYHESDDCLDVGIRRDRRHDNV